MNYLALNLPGGQQINAPKSVPTGGLDTLTYALQNGLWIMVLIAVIFALVMIAMAGVQWAGSGGDKGKVAQARARMTWAIIGLVITFSFALLLSIVGQLFGVKIF